MKKLYQKHGAFLCLLFLILCWSGPGLADGDVVNSFYTMKEHSAVGVLFQTLAAEYRLEMVEPDFEDSVVALALSNSHHLPLHFATSGTTISKLSVSEKQNDPFHTPQGMQTDPPKTSPTPIKTKITSFRSNAQGGIDVICDSCPTDKQTWYHLFAETENFALLVRKIAWAWKTQTAVVLEVKDLTIHNVLVERE